MCRKRGSTTGSSCSNGGPQHQEQQQQGKPHDAQQISDLQDERRTFSLRILFVVSMVGAAAMVGALAYAITKHMEEDIGSSTYQSIAIGALEEAQAIAQRKQHGGDILASIMGTSFPSASQWPLDVGLDGYTTIANKVAQQSSTSGHGMMVIVTPEEAEAFEAHAKELYTELEYPPTAGYSEFGFGIYKKNPTLPNTTDQQVHDISGETVYDSKRKIMVPFLQHSNTFRQPGLLLMNIYAQPFRGQVLDSIMDCAEAAELNLTAVDVSRDANHPTPPSCGVVTDFVEIFIRPGPAAVFFQPIFPLTAPTQVVGFVGTSIHWEEVLINVVPDYVNGLEMVITNGNQSYTYVIHQGEPFLKGDGDLHDSNFDDYGHTAMLSHVSETGASASVTYMITVYPTQSFFDAFRTSSPLYISLGFVAVLLLCAILFFIYDYFMQHQSRHRKKILKMKRRFVRYVSHEIRTPLNVVCMGLELIMTEVRDEINLLESKQKQAAQTQAQGGDATVPQEPPPPPSSFASSAGEQRMGAGKVMITRSTSNGGTLDTSTGASTASTATYWLDLLGDILENTQNAVSVLNDLLNYDKIESKTFTLEYGTVDACNLVHKTMSEFQIQAKNRNVHLELIHVPTTRGDAVDDAATTKTAWTHLRVLGDDIRLTQVIRNLLSNALKFSPANNGSILVKVEHCPEGLPQALDKLQKKQAKANAGGKSGSGGGDLSATPVATAAAGSIRITVQDNGVGLTPDQLETVFQEGVQFDANKLQSGGGSGLGLSISKEIVFQHGGAIHVSSQGRGQGTTFVVEIPLFDNGYTSNDDDDTSEKRAAAAAGAEHGSSTSQTSSGSGSSQNLQNQHILVVDDVISNTKMLVRLLERAGHTCVVACNGQEAIDAFLANQQACCDGETGIQPFDTILMDYEMRKYTTVLTASIAFVYQASL